MAEVRQPLDGRRPSTCIWVNSFKARSHLHINSMSAEHSISNMNISNKHCTVLSYRQASAAAVTSCSAA